MDIRELRKPQHVNDIGNEFLALHHVFGNDLTRRSNIHLVEDDRIAYAAGNAVIFENIWSHAKEYLMSIDDGGIGSIAVHPSRQYIAVGGKGFQPNIYIYSYPALEIVKVLKAGAERGYSCLDFNASGTRLASVATAPDYMLTVWDWESEKIVLHAKAFGQDVYKVAFSHDDDRRLTTSGTGHIRFWKMAATFTGQKLQGSIGKFGKVELSDVAAFIELPDGKVFSGTESGALLLWEGNFIKCRFVRPNSEMCHGGDVTFVTYDREQRYLITAGSDGVIRWWNFKEVDAAEVDADHSMDYTIEPMAEYPIGDGIGIKNMLIGPTVDGSRNIILNDSLGRTVLIKYKLDAEYNAPGIPVDAEVIVTGEFHGQAISGLDTSPLTHIAVTCSLDGTVAAWDYVRKQRLYSRKFSCPATSLAWVPQHIDSTGSAIAVGFQDGCIRILRLSSVHDASATFKQIMIMKPHNAAINHLSFSRTESILASAGKDGIVFFIDCTNGIRTNSDSHAKKWLPIRFVNISRVEEGRATIVCNNINWNTSGDSLLCACSDGIAREIDVKLFYDKNSTDDEDFDTYEASIPLKEYALKTVISSGPAASPEPSSPPSPSKANQSGKVQEAEEPVVKYAPLKIAQCAYQAGSESKYYAATALGTNYQFQLCSFSDDVPLSELPVGFYASDGKDAAKPPLVTTVKYNVAADFLMMGTSDGNVLLRPTEYSDTYVKSVCHNGQCGGVSGVTVSYDLSFVLSAGFDGTLVINRFLPDKVKELSVPLGKDIEAGVYTNQRIKEISKNAPPEPKFLYNVVEDAPLEGFGDLDLNANADVSLRFINEFIDEVGDLAGNAYSIQDAKLKSGEDHRKEAAESKKEKVRRIIEHLRQEYLALKGENAKLPSVVQLDDKEMTVDTAFFKALREEGERLIEEVHKECAYDAEKSLVLRRKIQTRLMEGILAEEMPLYGFAEPSPPVVYSLRTKGLDASLSSVLESVHEMVRNEEMLRSKNRVDEAMLKDILSDENMHEMSQVKSTDNVLSTARTEKGAEHSRRDQRKKRLEKLALHETQKPKEDEDDLRDITSIKEAEKTIGSYKLKCSSDYEISEEHRVNATKKHRQMLMLEESMIMARLRFNESFLALRSLKKEIVESVADSNERIRQIDMELDHMYHEEDLAMPALLSQEFPDDRDEVTKEDLEDYRANRSKNSWVKSKPPAVKVFSGKKTIIQALATGEYDVRQRPVPEILPEDKIVRLEDESRTPDMSKGRPVKKQVSIVDATDSYDRVLRFYDSSKLLESSPPELEVDVPVLMFANKCVKSLNETPSSDLSESMKRVKNERRRSLLFERNMLLERIKKNAQDFDSAIEDLRLERHSIISDLKLAELKLLTLSQEHMLLLTFEERDSALQQKSSRCRKEKNEIQTTTSDILAKLEVKQEEMTMWTSKQSNLTVEFRALVPESHAYADTLSKIYRKKIKRSKGMEDGDGDDFDEEEEEDEDEDFDDEEVEDICPPGCDVALYDQVLELREKRLDVEEVIAEIQKAVDDLKKSKDRLKQREKQIDKDAKQTESEIQQFQLQKQASLNQIDVYVPLAISQIYAFTSSGIMTGPADTEDTTNPVADQVNNLKSVNERSLVSAMNLKSHTLFRESALQRLHERIQELRNEASEARAAFKALHKEKKRLEKERESQRDTIENWRDKCNDLMMLKFGRLIDLDALDQGVDRSHEELDQAVKKMEIDTRKEVAKLQAELDSLRQVYADTTSSNTGLLREIEQLTDTKINVTKQLNAPSETYSMDMRLDDFRSQEERRKLTSFVQLQSREIENLKTEIMSLRRKDTTQFSMYLPVPPESTQGGGVVLPPIPQSKQGKQSKQGRLTGTKRTSSAGY